MKKSFLRFPIALLLMLALLLPGIPIYADETPVRNKRIVSVVYDDSGSMEGNRFAYANYGMQAFAGLMNAEDELYITYMSEPGTAVSVDLSNPSAAVKSIRGHSDSDWTPFSSVETAYKKLSACQDSNPNTQYWLMIFTDGEFNSKEMKDVQKTLEKYADAQMPNGTNPRIQFMSIGDADGSFTPQGTKINLSVTSVQDATSIVQSIYDISSEISGRFRVDAADIKAVDGKTIQVSANVPLLNIGILSQNSNASVETVLSSDKVPISLKSNIPISSPDSANPCMAGADSDALNMQGNVTLAGESGKTIPAGNYTITFTQDVSLDNVVVMLEPALELRITLYSGDTAIDDPNTVTPDMADLNAKAGIYEIGTDKLVLDSLLPAGVTYSMEHTVNGTSKGTSDKLVLSPVNAEDGENIITAALDLPGYFHLSASLEFTPTVIDITDLTAEVYYDGSERMPDENGNPDPENVVYVSELGKSRTGIKFTAYSKGVPLTEAQATKMLEEFKKGISATFPNYKVEVMPDGCYLVYPSRKPAKYVLNYLYYKTFNGEQTISATLNSHQAEGKLIFKLGKWYKDIIVPLIVLFGLYVLYQLFLRKRFKHNTIKVYSGVKDRRGNVKYPKNANFTKRVNIFSTNDPLNFFSLRPAKIKVGGFTIKAQHPIIKRSTTYKVVKLKDYGVSDANPKPPMSEQCEEILLTDNVYVNKNGSYYKIEKI